MPWTAHEFSVGSALCGSAGIYNDRPQMRWEGVVRATSFAIQQSSARHAD
jgi:hypothetical protein